MRGLRSHPVLLLRPQGSQRRGVAASRSPASSSDGGGGKVLNPLAAALVPDSPDGRRQWHVRGGRGGTNTLQLHAQKRGVEGLSVERLTALRRSLGVVLGQGHRAVKAVSSAVERAAVLRRDWTDESFQEGQEGNDQRVAVLEREFESSYRAAGSSLKDPVVLGQALDLVGAYLKNYKVAKAAAIMREALPQCRARRGVWLIKGLNHASTVLMKQQRYPEAYAMLRELEGVIWYKPEEAPELWDILYRNIGMVLQSLGRSEEAMAYFLKCATVKGVATWWDLWDVGYCLATLAFTTKDPDALRRAASMLEDALPLHKEAEPGEDVMHAKILQALADCYMALAVQLGEGDKTPGGKDEQSGSRKAADAALALSGKQVPIMTVDEYLELADQRYREAHRLFSESCGESNDLSGWCAAATALCLVQRRKHAEAQPYAQHALHVFSVSDIPKLTQLQQTLEIARECHTTTHDQAWLRELIPTLNSLCTRLEAPTLKDEGGVLPAIRLAIGSLLVASGDQQNISRGVSLLSGAAPATGLSR
eukprot:Hpha_TRINITY_DN23175_c0_g1::TRINITY_DN23175_c0_g1_i1::g.29495::m.29495